MASTTAPLSVTVQHTAESRRWRWAGALGLAHLVLMLAAFATEGVAAAQHGASATSVRETFRGLSTTRVELGSYLEAMSFTALVPALVLLAGLLSARSEVGRVAARTALVLGAAYVASTFAVGFPPLTSAVYAAHHGVDASTVATMNDLRNYGFLLQVALSLAFTLALGIAALHERVLVRWLGWGGVAVGGIGLVVTPFAHNATSMLWMVWWLGTCVLCLRGGPGGRRS